MVRAVVTADMLASYKLWWMEYSRDQVLDGFIETYRV